MKVREIIAKVPKNAQAIIAKDGIELKRGDITEVCKGYLQEEVFAFIWESSRSCYDNTIYIELW